MTLGNIESAYCIIDSETYKILDFGKVDNFKLLDLIKYTKDIDELAIEMIASYGMAVGQTVFETCVWIGRFIEANKGGFNYVYRKDVKINLCGSMRAKDSNIRQALIDRFGVVGTKKHPRVFLWV